MSLEDSLGRPASERRKAIKNTLAKIKVLEARLTITDGAVKLPPHMVGLLPDTAIILYYHLLGDAYWELLKLNYASAACSTKAAGLFDAKERCLAALKIAHRKAEECLEPCKLLRLLCTYSYCSAIIKLNGKVSKAYEIATGAFESASLHTNDIDEKVIELLQRIREDILGAQPTHASTSNPSGADTTSAEEEESEIDFGFGDDNAEQVNGSIKGAKTVRGTKGSEKSNRSSGNFNSKGIGSNSQRSGSRSRRQSSAVISAEQYAVNLLTGDDAADGALENNANLQKNVDAVLRLKRAVALPVPVQLESVPSSALILKALDRIFRVYVRGNALPGQLIGGSTVEFDGNPLSFRNFILDGPYLSFRGFVQFLLDFNVSKPPPKDSPLGRKFAQNIYNASEFDDDDDGIGGTIPSAPNTARGAISSRGSGGGGGGGGGSGGRSGRSGMGGAGAASMGPLSSPVSMRDAALLFIECYRSITPALMLRKFGSIYHQMAAQAEVDPWQLMLQYVSTPALNNWDIKCGINFMQFVDCLGKLGVLTYSSPRFVEIFPTIPDRVGHFLSAFLGLVDERKWKIPVDRKLLKIQSIIKQAGASEKKSAVR